MAQTFSIILVLITLLSGIIWFVDAKVFAKKRQAKLELALAGGVQLDEETKDKMTRENVLVENARSIFPVIAIITVFRSFLYEPFQIPSGSMMPTLLVGDFILVEKYSYGIKDPVWRSKLVETGEPERGDVAVFKYPEDPSIDYIKRVVGLPGDTLRYGNKTLWIKPSCERSAQCDKFVEVAKTKVDYGHFHMGPYPLTEYKQDLLGLEHNTLVAHDLPDLVHRYHKQDNQPRGQFVVPQGHYFVMGDNRDNSLDSRAWGFVPEHNLVGKAVFIWISFEFNRGEDSILPKFIPTDIRFNRIGGIH